LFVNTGQANSAPVGAETLCFKEEDSESVTKMI